MARGDLLIKLVRASVAGDQSAVRAAVEAIIAEEKHKQHTVLADRLTRAMQVNGNGISKPSHNALGKGTVCHHRWESEDATQFVDNGNLLLDVTCLPAAGELDDSIDYAVVVTLEVGQTVAVPVYERVRERLREIVRVWT